MGYLDFDANTVEPNQPFEVLPAGDYIGRIVSSEIKPTASGSGEYLKLEIEVLGPTGAGRKVFDQINIRNESAEAERIGRGQLSALCHAIGVLRVRDSQELHGKPFTMKIVVKEDAQYGKKNQIKGYKKAEGAPAVSPMALAQPPQPSAPQAAKSAPTPPWVKSA